MQRLATISLPAKASTVSTILSQLVEGLGGDRLYLAHRSDGLAVYTDSDGWTGLVPQKSQSRELR